MACGEHGVIAKETMPLKPLSETLPTVLTPATCTTSVLHPSDNLPQVKKRGFLTSGFLQFWIQSKKTTFITLVALFIIGIILGCIYYDIGNNGAKVTSNAECLFLTIMFIMITAMMPTILTFSKELSVFVRGHWNSLIEYYLCKMLADIPFQIVLTACYVMAVYYLTSQPLETKRFAMVLLISVLTALVSQSFGLLVGAAFNLKVGVFVGLISTILLVLFAGFFVNLNDIPVLKWVPYMTYVKYSFEATMIAVYGLERPKLRCNIPYCEFKNPRVFLEHMAMQHDMSTFAIDVVVLCGLFIVLRVFAYFVLRIKLPQIR